MKKVSRQRLWQRKMQAEHRCITCGKPAYTVLLCYDCAVKRRERARKKFGYKKRYNSKTYRKDK